jgi:hypothetical protein
MNLILDLLNMKFVQDLSLLEELAEYQTQAQEMLRL